MGILWNFGNVLNEAQNNFFVWAAVDEIWEPNFLEKNMQSGYFKPSGMSGLGR